MQVNLSNVHIPLQQFHEVASGQQDAGYVRLSSETALAGTSAAAAGLVPAEIDRSEIIAIKHALLSALSEYGFKDKNKLNSIRQRLGLAPKGRQQADDMTVLAVRYLRPPTVYSRAFPPTQEGIAAASRFLDDVLGKSAWREARVTGLGILMIKKMASSVQYHRSRSRNFLVVERTEQT